MFDYGLQLQFGADPAMKAMKDGIGTLWDKLGLVFPFDSALDLSEAGKFAEAFGLSGVMDRSLIDMMGSLVANLVSASRMKQAGSMSMFAINLRLNVQ